LAKNTNPYFIYLNYSSLSLADKTVSPLYFHGLRNLHYSISFTAKAYLMMFFDIIKNKKANKLFIYWLIFF
jgi:hypothetical protein